jgi:peptidyl-tRNA hydrolase, PTH1 family
MKLLIGLGNPGEKYVNTRHNIGALVVSAFAQQFAFPKFKLNKKFKSLMSKGKVDDQNIVLAIPQTFMNNSGLAVQLLVTGYRLPITDLIIVHDELDLDFGKIKIKKDGSSAGHNGIKSILESLGDENFVRFRLGVANDQRGKIPAEKFVLQKFGKVEEKELQKKIVPASIIALETALKEGVEKTMQEFN